MLLLLIPICLFWMTAALYLGGMNVDIVGGNGLRQVVGLLATFVLFVAVWRVLNMVLGGFLPAPLGNLALPTIVAVVGLPLWSRAGFAIMGVKIRKGQHAAH